MYVRVRACGNCYVAYVRACTCTCVHVSVHACIHADMHA